MTFQVTIVFGPSFMSFLAGQCEFCWVIFAILLTGILICFLKAILIPLRVYVVSLSATLVQQ